MIGDDNMSSLNFEKVYFDCGWKIDFTINLFNKEYPIVFLAQAYYDTEKVTDKQKDGLKDYENKIIEIKDLIEYSLIKEAGTEENAINRFLPKIMQFEKDGSYALLLDDADNFEDGLVICIYPKFSLMSIDEYL